MKRYFYSGNQITKKLLDNQFNLIRMEDQVYRDALLAALKLETNKIEKFNSLRETILDMTIHQQAQYARNYHLEQLFKHLDSLHKNSKGRSMLIKGKQSLTKDLVDPDKFPIWDLKKKPNIFYSIWNTILGKIRYDTGFQLIVQNSLIQHPEGGRGVFVNLAANRKEISVGDFLGIVPGTIFYSYELYRKIRLEELGDYERVPQHLHFPSGKVLELGEYTYYDHVSRTNVDIEPFMINPYSLGQFINHPPYGQLPNVIFTEIQVPLNFYPSYLKKYLPYNTYLPKQVKQKNEKLTVFGIFARKPIKNNQQLYVDYCQNHIYPIDNIPQWLTQPPYQQYLNSPNSPNSSNSPNSPNQPNSPDPQKQPNIQCLNFSKQQYENPSPIYWRIMEKEALKEKQKLYESYLNSVKYRPKGVLYEDGEVRIRKMDGGIGTGGKE